MIQKGWKREGIVVESGGGIAAATFGEGGSLGWVDGRPVDGSGQETGDKTYGNPPYMSRTH